MDNNNNYIFYIDFSSKELVHTGGLISYVNLTRIK